MKRIDTVAELKQEATYNELQPTATFFILLKGGVRSYKHIIYFPDTGRFDVYHTIDERWEEGLTEEELVEKTQLVQAMVRGVFFREG